MNTNHGEVWLKREDIDFAILFPSYSVALEQAKRNSAVGITSALYTSNGEERLKIVVKHSHIVTKTGNIVAV